MLLEPDIPIIGRITMLDHERTIFAAFYRPSDRVCWLIAEADDKKNLVEGFLIGNEYGGWGKADLKAMKEHGAIQITSWKPCSFHEAINRIQEHLRSLSVQTPF